MVYNSKIIIPSATVIPEGFQGLGKIPGIIYPLNNKIVFDYLYNQYKNFSSIQITCYERIDMVKRRLINYLDKVDNVYIKQLSLLRDLGHTIYDSLENIREPIIINFSDTIVQDDISKLIDSDSFYYYKDFMSDRWTYFDEKEGKITNIYDKNSTISTLIKKFFVGIFSIRDTIYFKKCLETSFNISTAEINTFYSALQMYSIKYPMKAFIAHNWIDIGHQDKYYKSKLEVKPREFNHIQIDKKRGILKKISDNKEKLINEILWYLKLPKDIEYVRPRIFDYSTVYEHPYISMEYYSYHTIHELFLYGDLTYQQWLDIFTQIHFICNDFKRYTVTDDNVILSLKKIYLTKTLQRLSTIKNDKNFMPFFEKSIHINGIKYKSLTNISAILEKSIPDILYNIHKFTIIHGDLCFTNIMVDNNISFIKLIDPRGKFGAYDIYGDPRYDLAKILHSIDGKYDFIIKDLFEIDYNLQKSTINYNFLENETNINLYTIFIDVFKKEFNENSKEIEFIEALLFLSMIALHKESLKHQLVMLGTGLNILNRIIDITEKDTHKNV